MPLYLSPTADTYVTILENTNLLTVRTQPTHTHTHTHTNTQRILGTGFLRMISVMSNPRMERSQVG